MWSRGGKAVRIRERPRDAVLRAPASLVAFLLRDVAYQATNRAPCSIQRRHRVHATQKPAPSRREIDSPLVDLRRSTGQHPPQSFHVVSRPALVEDLRERAPDQFVAWTEQHRFIAGPDVEVFPSAVELEYDFIRRARECGQSRLALTNPNFVLGDLRLQRRIRGAQALLARAECVLGTPATRTEFAEQQAQSDEDEISGHMVRQDFERIHRRDEPVQHSRCADERCEQAGSASAIPGAQDHCRNGKLIDADAFRKGKYPVQEQRKAGQHKSKAIAPEHVSHLCRQVHRQSGAAPRGTLRGRATNLLANACAA